MQPPAGRTGVPSHPVNHAVERASTLLFPTYDDYLEGGKAITYGRLGTTNHRAAGRSDQYSRGAVLKRALPASGLQACIASILAFVKAGDEVLMTDSAYDPTRKFCDHFLARFGVKTTFYDPLIGAGIEELMTENTKVIFTESPGSLTFEVQDIPAFGQSSACARRETHHRQYMGHRVLS